MEYREKNQIKLASRCIPQTAGQAEGIVRLRAPFSAEFFGHCVLSGGTPCRALCFGA